VKNIVERKNIYKVYIKHPLLLNKQFSIDSFLDWEGFFTGFSRAYLPLASVPLALRRRSTEHASDVYSKAYLKGKVARVVVKATT